MGWSCSHKASLSLSAIEVLCKETHGYDNDPHNIFYSKGNKYFYEIGREQRDGSISGTIYKYTENDLCRQSGSFKIESSGKVSRGPALFKSVNSKNLLVIDMSFVGFFDKELNEDNLHESVMEFYRKQKQNGEQYFDVHLKQYVDPIPSRAEAVNFNNNVSVKWKRPQFLAAF